LVYWPWSGKSGLKKGKASGYYFVGLDGITKPIGEQRAGDHCETLAPELLHSRRFEVDLLPS
jgi:hypothetical protein